VPPGWLLCDGANGTPDLRGRFVLGGGFGKNLTERKLGDNGGEENHILSVTELSEHFHQLYLIKYSENIADDQFIYDDDGKYTTTQKKNTDNNNEDMVILMVTTNIKH
jgi:microcystin-dependent protein